MNLNDLPEDEREIIKQCASEAGVTEEEIFAAAKEYAKDAVEFMTFKLLRNLGHCSDLFH